jgi:predicted phage-related endonuclease
MLLYMAAKETTLNELGAMLAHVVEHMATKDEVRAIVKDEISVAKLASKADFAALAEQVAGIERDLKAIRRDLDDLVEKVENITGYRKEIDHAFERITTIEKHLGIYKQAA